MARIVDGLRLVALTVAVQIAVAGPLAARQPAPGPMRALQKLAEQQGHPGAAVKDLRNFGFEVPLDVEAAAAGVTPDALRKAIEQDAPLTSRIETARGKRLSSDQAKKIGEAERQLARDREPLQKKYAQDVAQITGLPESKARKIVARDQGTPAAGKKTLAEIEKSLGRRLAAGDANRFTAARDEFFAACQSQRKDLARQVAKITDLPQSVVWELVR